MTTYRNGIAKEQTIGYENDGSTRSKKPRREPVRLVDSIAVDAGDVSDVPLVVVMFWIGRDIVEVPCVGRMLNLNLVGHFQRLQKMLEEQKKVDGRRRGKGRRSKTEQADCGDPIPYPWGSKKRGARAL